MVVTIGLTRFIISISDDDIVFSEPRTSEIYTVCVGALECTDVGNSDGTKDGCLVGVIDGRAEGDNSEYSGALQNLLAGSMHSPPLERT